MADRLYMLFASPSEQPDRSPHRMDTMLGRCAANKLVVGRGPAVGSSVTMAAAGRERRLNGSTAALKLRTHDAASRSVVECLAALDAAPRPTSTSRHPSSARVFRRRTGRRRSRASSARPIVLMLSGAARPRHRLRPRRGYDPSMVLGRRGGMSDTVVARQNQTWQATLKPGTRRG